MSVFSYISKSVFSAGNIFLFILLAIVAMFIISSASSIMTYMGFETKQSIKASLVQTQDKLNIAVQVNKDNAKNLADERKANEQMRVQIASINQKALYVERLITLVKETKAKRDAPVIQRVIEKTVTTAQTVTLPIEEVNSLSGSNIEQVHEVFATLFPAT